MEVTKDVLEIPLEQASKIFLLSAKETALLYFLVEEVPGCGNMGYTLIEYIKKTL